MPVAPPPMTAMSQGVGCESNRWMDVSRFMGVRVLEYPIEGYQRNQKAARKKDLTVEKAEITGCMKFSATATHFSLLRYTQHISSMRQVLLFCTPAGQG